MGSRAKLKRQQERELIDDHHKVVTEEALEPLYQSFMDWKQGTLPYYELTELIHVIHKKNQEIYKDLNYTERSELVLYAKFKMGRLSGEDVVEYKWLLERWGYQDNNG